ncbi:MAG: flagellar hook-basal body protein [Fimbriimonadaceae bacterium]|nr:flagellar hook-basal body protein [Fimbriimonadaceae bacterium]
MSTSTKWMEVIANNLANTSTTGFKRDVMVFNDGLMREMARDSGRGETIGQLGAGAIPMRMMTIFEAGVHNPTGNPLDLAIANDHAMFSVQTPQGVRYSRDGAFALNTERQLVTKNGSLVLDGNGQPIVIPPGKMEIAQDGAITVNEQQVAQIALFEGQFSKMGDSLFAGQSTQRLPAERAQMLQGFIESSNVNAVTEMIAMIRLHRAFDMAQKSAMSQDEATQRLLQTIQGQ